MSLISQQWKKSGPVAFEKIEAGLKAALMRDGTALLSQFLEDLPLEADASRHGEETWGKRSRQVQTLLGPIQLKRRYYYDRQMRRVRVPLDEALGLIDGYSPGMARLMCWSGSQCSSFVTASEALRRLGGLHLESRQIQRMVGQLGPKLAEVLDQPWQAQPEAPAPVTYISLDGTGVPMVREELQGRAGKQPDGTAKTREVKLGCIFSQHHIDEKGRPWRDLDSTTYVASFETAADFGHRLYREAVRRRVPQAPQVVVIADGAPWIWDQVQTHFPKAVQILDFYHASEHLRQLAEILEEGDLATIPICMERWQGYLKNDQLDQILAEALAKLPCQGQRRKDAERQMAYLESHRLRLAYGTFRKRGWFIGSGVIEAGCKTVIGQRVKQSGMFWSLQGAQNILTLRCATSSRRFDEAWDQLALAA